MNKRPEHFNVKQYRKGFHSVYIHLPYLSWHYEIPTINIQYNNSDAHPHPVVFLLSSPCFKSETIHINTRVIKTTINKARTRHLVHYKAVGQKAIGVPDEIRQLRGSQHSDGASTRGTRRHYLQHGKCLCREERTDI